MDRDADPKRADELNDLRVRKITSIGSPPSVSAASAVTYHLAFSGLLMPFEEVQKCRPPQLVSSSWGTQELVVTTSVVGDSWIIAASRSTAVTGSMLNSMCNTVAPVLSCTLTLIPSMTTDAMVGVGVGVGLADFGAAAAVDGAGAGVAGEQALRLVSASTATVARMAECPPARNRDMLTSYRRGERDTARATTAPP